jgi:hypothetical protein
MHRTLKPTVPNICPECGHQFKGNGFDGIDAHWRAKHERIMPYPEAWPLIRSGTHLRKTGSIAEFSGCLETKDGPKLTIEKSMRLPFAPGLGYAKDCLSVDGVA